MMLAVVMVMLLLVVSGRCHIFGVNKAGDKNYCCAVIQTFNEILDNGTTY